MVRRPLHPFSACYSYSIRKSFNFSRLGAWWGEGYHISPSPCSKKGTSLLFYLMLPTNSHTVWAPPPPLSTWLINLTVKWAPSLPAMRVAQGSLLLTREAAGTVKDTRRAETYRKSGDVQYHTQLWCCEYGITVACTVCPIKDVKPQVVTTNETQFEKKSTVDR